MPKKINKIENQKGAFFIPILIGIAVVSALAGGGAAIASKLKSNFLGSIIIGVAEIIYNIGKGLAYFSSMLFNQVLVSDWMNKPITSNATFVLGWTEVRD
ncbi:MAG: hypothetical protein NTV36_03540, partial [Candidatus Staskawiczbacteria bacterium]|nr:hypothetical protein [Candidatus Staskawiczbacteria bacterium]